MDPICLGIFLEGLSRTTATSHAILCTGQESAVHHTHTVQNCSGVAKDLVL